MEEVGREIRKIRKKGGKVIKGREERKTGRG